MGVIQETGEENEWKNCYCQRAGRNLSLSSIYVQFPDSRLFSLAYRQTQPQPPLQQTGNLAFQE